MSCNSNIFKLPKMRTCTEARLQQGQINLHVSV